MERLRNSDAVLRLQDITKRIRSNDNTLSHFEPLPQTTSKEHQEQQQQSGHGATATCNSSTCTKLNKLSLPSSIPYKRQTVSNSSSFYSFAIQLTSFSLFENEDFQMAFRDCLEALSSTEDNEKLHDGSVENELAATRISFRNDDNLSAWRSVNAIDQNVHEVSSAMDFAHGSGRDPTNVKASQNLTDTTDSVSKTTMHHDITEDTFQSSIPIVTPVKQKYYRKNSNITKVTLRALPEPDLRLALDAVSSLCNLQDLQIVNSPQSQCLSVQDVTRVLVSLHRSKHRGVGIDVTYNTTSSLLRTTRKLPNRDNGINSNGGLRRLNITTRIQVKTQRQLEELALGLRLHSSTLEYVNLHILPRCSSIECPNMNLNSVIKALSSSSASRSNRLRTCRMVLGYEHNPFGKQLIKPSTLHQLLTSCTKLRKLQLDNFGMTDEHIRVVAQVIHASRDSLSTAASLTSCNGNKITLRLRELQLARNQHYHYHHQSNESVPSSFGLNNGTARVFSGQALTELCQAVLESNFTLRKLCILTADEINRMKESHRYQVTGQDPSISSIQCLVHAQRTLNMYTRLNQLGRFRLYQLVSEENHPWLEALFAAANNSIKFNEKFEDENSSSSFDYDDSLSETLQERNSTQNDEDDGQTEDLSVIYTLLRSNPAIILSCVSCCIDNLQHFEATPEFQIIDLVALSQHAEAAKTDHGTENNDSNRLSENNQTIVHDAVASSAPSSLFTYVDKDLNGASHDAAHTHNGEADALDLKNKDFGSFWYGSHQNDGNSAIDESIDISKQRVSSSFTQANRIQQHQRPIKGWFRNLGNSINHKAVDIIKRLDIRLVEYEKHSNSVITRKCRQSNCDIFCDATEEDDETSDNEGTVVGTSKIEFDDEDSLSRYKSSTLSTTIRRRGTRKRSSFGADEVSPMNSNPTRRASDNFIDEVSRDMQSLVLWEVPTRLPPPLLTASRNEVHPMRFVVEHRISNQRQPCLSPTRAVTKRSSY
jgi:hypothetical protein